MHHKAKSSTATPCSGLQGGTHRNRNHAKHRRYKQIVLFPMGEVATPPRSAILSSCSPCAQTAQPGLANIRQHLCRRRRIDDDSAAGPWAKFAIWRRHQRPNQAGHMTSPQWSEEIDAGEWAKLTTPKRRRCAQRTHTQSHVLGSRDSSAPTRSCAPCMYRHVAHMHVYR